MFPLTLVIPKFGLQSLKAVECHNFGHVMVGHFFHRVTFTQRLALSASLSSGGLVSYDLEGGEGGKARKIHMIASR